ncbi:MAG: hypothetical protein LBC77_02610 [Spirochaetaceae bacterium]|jgi:hypothetical protein|nr:hypothetical protein [Spirochaetaceae bacterium]
MKTIQNGLALAVLCAAAVVMAGCASILKGPSRPQQKSELLDWKGAAFGTPVPQWVMAAQDNDLQIQALQDFKNQACFVVSREEPGNKDFAVTWVGNAANGASEVARIISTTVNNTAEAQISAKSGSEAAKRTANEMRDAMSNASFKGFRKAADFWALIKNKSTKKEYYTAYSLWVIPNEELNQQLAANYQNIIDNNKAMSEAERSIYRDIINDIRKRGITNVK